jgi:hypothetical protein
MLHQCDLTKESTGLDGLHMLLLSLHAHHVTMLSMSSVQKCSFNLVACMPLLPLTTSIEMQCKSAAANSSCTSYAASGTPCRKLDESMRLYPH